MPANDRLRMLVYFAGLSVVLIGCAPQEYQPPKDSIPDIPPGRTNGIDDLSPPKR